MTTTPPERGTPCAVFLLCTNEATTWHDAGPVGTVPACQRCADKMAWLKERRP